MPDYALYGLVVRCDHAIDGLDAAAPDATPDITVVLDAGGLPTTRWDEAAVHYRWPPEADGELTVEVRRAVDGGFRFWYADGTEFTLDRRATHIQARWAPASSLEDTATYLLGPVLGFALRLRGVLALHASAVLVDGRAVALVGPSGAGKSTTAAAFAAAGYPVLADDVLALRIAREEVLAYPSYRLLRLWDESEQILFGSRGALPLLTPTWDKRALPLGGEFPFHQAPVPLGDVFLLAPRADEAHAPYVERIRASDALMSLVMNTYANYLLDHAMRADELRALEGLVRGRRIRRLVPHQDPARLGALVETVCMAAREA